MEYRRLGRTEDKVSVIGMGTWRVGVFSGPEERASQVNALRKGVELGINLIDTAEMYAAGRSEEVVGDAVKGIRNEVFIATKVSPDHLRHDDVIAACDRSLKRLGTPYIDLYQVHWPNSNVPISETMSAMEELVSAGKIRHIGVSNFDVRLMEQARSSLSKADIVSNQVEYSLSARGAEADVLPYCERESMTMIAYSPLVRGNIPKTGMPVEELARRHATPAQAALSWATRNKHVVAIPKATRIEHLEQNAASASLEFTDAEYDQIASS